tara:strand:+ start:4468 stop:5643 length:1176 start_codon:yes stop_codon:yes gene_type:complete
MNQKIFYFIPILLLLAGCDLGEKQEYETSDAELIQMIIESEKVDIDISELPEESRDYLNNDSEYDEMGSRYASQLGYEVDRIGKGAKSGRRGDAYFNLEGRKLNPNDWGRKGRGFGIDQKEDWECFTLMFPVSFDMPDGSSVTIEADDEASWTEVKSWYDSNLDSEERPTMQFPIVILLDEESVTIESQEEMRSAYQECNPKRKVDWSRDEDFDGTCFDLVYPVTYVMPDGSTIIVEGDDEDGWSDLKDWYEENGDSEDKPELQYPVDIILETEEGSSTVTINNEEEMASAKRECHSESEEDWDDGDERECFEYVLPVTFVMPDGSTIIVEGEEGWYVLRVWYEENRGYEEEPTVQYPIDITQETEEGIVTVTLTGDEEMEEVYSNCPDDN